MEHPRARISERRTKLSAAMRGLSSEGANRKCGKDAPARNSGDLFHAAAPERGEEEMADMFRAAIVEEGFREVEGEVAIEAGEAGDESTAIEAAKFVDEGFVDFCTVRRHFLASYTVVVACLGMGMRIGVGLREAIKSERPIGGIGELRSALCCAFAVDELGPVTPVESGGREETVNGGRAGCGGGCRGRERGGAAAGGVRGCGRGGFDGARGGTSAGELQRGHGGVDAVDGHEDSSTEHAARGVRGAWKGARDGRILRQAALAERLAKGLGPAQRVAVVGFEAASARHYRTCVAEWPLAWFGRMPGL